MAFKEPFAAYNAANDLEAHFVCNILNEADIEAVVVEDVSTAGLWLGGMIPEIHKTQVWIEKVDAERAKPVLEDYEHRLRARREADANAEGELLEVTCEECGKGAKFPIAQRGSVQNCPHCGAFVDVGEVGDTAEWSGVPEDETAES